MQGTTTSGTLFLTAAAAAAGLGPVKEGRFLLPGCDRRPAEVLLHNWAQGRDAALDVTVVTPMRQDLVEEAASTPGHALSVKYDEKLNGAEELCQRQGIAFFPLAAETFGARLSTTSGVVWQFCCSGATLQFWETGFLISHHHKLMDYTSNKNMIYYLDCTVPDIIKCALT